jgi:hypothetical protein
MSYSDVKRLRGNHMLGCAKEPWGEAAAAAVMLRFDRIAADRRFSDHVDPQGADWGAILDDVTWSTTEWFLIATAAGLWTGRRSAKVDISEIGSLDDEFFGVWHDMITAYRTGRIPASPGQGAAS